MKVRDIMDKEVKSLAPDESASDALGKLLKLKISGLPVIDGEKKLLGMFTEKEVLTRVLPGYLRSVGTFVYEMDPKAIREKVEHFPGFKVKDVMRREVITVGEDATIAEAAHLMLTQKARRLPVLNKAGEVIGIIARVDVVKALFGI